MLFLPFRPRGGGALLPDRLQRSHAPSLRPPALNRFPQLLYCIFPHGITFSSTSTQRVSTNTSRSPSSVMIVIFRKPRLSNRRSVHGNCAHTSASCREKSLGRSCRPRRCSRQPMQRQPFHALIPACFHMASLTE